MKYIVSNYGLGITVGLLNKETAEEEMNLAQNLYNVNVDYSLFHGSINFASLRQFKRFLIYKNYFSDYFADRDAPFNAFKLLRGAVNKMKQTMDSNVCFNNFMSHIHGSNNHYNVSIYDNQIDQD